MSFTPLRNVCLAAVLGLTSLSIAGCEDEPDNAAEQVGEAVEDAGDTVQDAAEDAGDAVEDATE